MTHELTRLRALAVRVGNGDQLAAAHLLRALEPRVRRIVRRVMRRRSAFSPMAARILLEVRRVATASHNPDQDQLATTVAHNICAALIDQLRAAPDGWPVLRDTILD